LVILMSVLLSTKTTSFSIIFTISNRTAGELVSAFGAFPKKSVIEVHKSLSNRKLSRPFSLDQA